MSDDLNAAVAAGVVGSEERYRRLLGSIVEVARSIFQARASSILLYEEETEELVFAAVVGEGEEELHGQRFPAGTGIAGWVLTTQTPLVIEDVQQDPRFARTVAEGTGYVPKGLMAVPLLDEDRVLGVLEVLDRPRALALLARGDEPARALRRAGGGRRRPAPAGAARGVAARGRGGACRGRPARATRSTRSATTRARRRCG